MDSSDQAKYQEVMNASAPSEQSINQQGFIRNPPTYSELGHHQDFQSQPGFINHGFQQDVHQQPEFVNQGFQQDVHHKPGFVPNPHQPINTLPTIVPPIEDPNEAYCYSLHKNRRQTGSIAGGLFLILVSGLHIGWGIWRTIFTGLWLIGMSYSIFIFTIMAWPLGAFVGGFIGSAITPILRKNIIYFIGAMIMTIGNVIFIIWDYEYIAIIIGRIFTSLAHGIVFVAIITQAGENSAKNMRGTILSTINCMLYTSIFISTIIIGTVQFTWLGWPLNISIERMIGIMGLIFALSSIICTVYVTVETVPFFLRQNQPNDAMANLKHLRDVPNETPQITNEMEEFTSMVMQDQRDSCNIFTNGNGKPLMLMIITRLLVALTNNLLINSVLLDLTAVIFSFQQVRYVSMVIVAPRLLMSVVQIFYADFFKRKTHIIVSSILAGIALIGLGITINTIDHVTLANYFVPSIFCIIFQLFCSIGMDQMQDVYFSEAFSTAKKPWSISFVAGIEHMFHMFMIGMTFLMYGSLAEVSALIFITGIVIIIFGLMLSFALPETRRMTLKQARDIFRNQVYFDPIKIDSPYA